VFFSHIFVRESVLAHGVSPSSSWRHHSLTIHSFIYPFIPSFSTQSRREKQYVLLNKLTEADQTAVKARDENEQLREAADALTERVHELEQQLVEANLWRQDDERNSDQVLNEARALLRTKDDTIAALEKDKAELDAQLLELSDTIQQVGRGLLCGPTKYSYRPSPSTSTSASTTGSTSWQLAR
jgi:hypothetical protein